MAKNYEGLSTVQISDSLRISCRSQRCGFVFGDAFQILRDSRGRNQPGENGSANLLIALMMGRIFACVKEFTRFSWEAIT
jgi:hypothetical protein